MKKHTALTLCAALLLAGGAHAIDYPAADGLPEAGARIASLLRRSAEGATKGNLGAIRSALSIYYGDMEGRYPAHPEQLRPQYLMSIPMVRLPGTGHEPTREVRVISDVPDMAALHAQLGDTGKWLFVHDPDSPMDGWFLIDCTHADAAGEAWHSY